MRLLGGVLAILHATRSGVRVSVLLVLSASFALAACQSTGKSGGTVATTPGQAQADFYDCLDGAFDAPVLGTGGEQAVASRFINRCNRELANWEDALVNSGTPPDQADQMIDRIRDNLRDEIANNLTGPI